MSRILKRPMFRMGGSTEDSGIMSGMRTRFENGGKTEEALSELDRLAPMPERRVTELLQNIGLNILANPSQGNVFRTVAAAARDPLRQSGERDFQSALLRRQTVGGILGQQREQADKERLLGMRIEADKEIAGLRAGQDLAANEFPNDPPSVANAKYQIIETSPIISSGLQIIVAPANQQIKTIRSLNPNSGDFFVIANTMGQPEKYVKVEKDEKNRIKLIEVDSNGETIDDIETDMGETRDITDNTYRERIAKDLAERRKKQQEQIEESFGVEDRDILQP
tara:strand:+ start:79 stop:921 length:843 start_codon:yes stop_codon:yes gene_type:complete